jgi:phosphoribosyl 1,2-cyclic phosphodiesterase
MVAQRVTAVVRGSRRSLIRERQGALVFLGTGASGGTSGHGRSRRRESSVWLRADIRVLIDVTRDFAPQASLVDAIDCVLLTHGHRDACGGIPALRDWCDSHAITRPIPVFASPETLRVIRRRVRRLDHCRLVPSAPGITHRSGAWRLTPLEVPHASRSAGRTYAWKLTDGRRTIVYASDVARLIELERFAAGASILVIDGAMWRRRLFTHLTIDEALPSPCRWRVERIAVTQIGRSAPPHAKLTRETQARCPRARPAWDGMVVALERKGAA